MDITTLTRHSPQELTERLRQVPLLQQPHILVYAEALISLEQIHPDRLAPPKTMSGWPNLKKCRSCAGAWPSMGWTYSGWTAS